MKTVHFGKSHYHLQGVMINWCNKHVGVNPPNDDWAWNTIKEWDREGPWCIQSAFGNTWFYFKNDSDATMFALRWADSNDD